VFRRAASPPDVSNPPIVYGVASVRSVEGNVMPEPSEPDEYETDTHRWWHLSEPSPELLRAIADGWLVGRRVLDIGCGLGTEVGYLASLGRSAVGIDLSLAALRRAATMHATARFAAGDVLHVPFRDRSFGAALDRGCFHYLAPHDRRAYADEVRRVTGAGGRLLLRACLTSAGERNDVDMPSIRDAFSEWHWLEAVEERIPSDTRTMPALVVRLEVPADP
jgi:SAM-dependent methyltransferase